MKGLLSAGIAVATLLSVPALAADMPVKAPVYKSAPAEVFDWGGFYIGANVGYGVAKDPSSSNLLVDSAFTLEDRFNLSSPGVSGGGQVGYNWQASPNWVVGAEADVQGSAQKDSTTCVTGCNNVVGIVTRVTQELPWFGTLRGRLGWTDGPALYYLTGGLAYGGVTTGATVDLGPGPVSASFSHTTLGWTFGGGIEAQVVGNWTAKVEYLYIDLGNVRDSFHYRRTIIATESSDIRNHLVRLGLNYKFGDPVARSKAPHRMRPAVSAVNWSGFYLGANVGYGVARNVSGSNASLPGGFFFPETFNVSPQGVLGGGQVGYNWQAAPNWVFGVEADFQGSAQKDSTTCVTGCINVAILGMTQVTQKLPWFGTLRGRLGWTSGPALYYLTAGLAYGGVTTDVTADLGLGPVSASFSHAKSGWTIGGGIETQVAGNWTAKVEYLYIDLGSVTDSFIYTPFPIINFTESSDIRNHVVRLALNYRFGFGTR